jgi:serine/threonine protein kinase
LDDFIKYQKNIISEIATIQKLHVEGLENVEPRYILRSLGYYIKREEREDMGVIEVFYQIFLLYPLMKGDLKSLIKGKNSKKFSEDEVILFLIQIIKAIDLLRCNYGIQHRDLKP